VNKIKGWYSIGYLSLYDYGNIYQFVAFKLFDFVPKDVIDFWKDELNFFAGKKVDTEENSRQIKQCSHC